MCKKHGNNKCHFCISTSYFTFEDLVFYRVLVCLFIQNDFALGSSAFASFLKILCFFIKDNIDTISNPDNNVTVYANLAVTADFNRLLLCQSFPAL